MVTIIRWFLCLVIVSVAGLASLVCNVQASTITTEFKVNSYIIDAYNKGTGTACFINLFDHPIIITNSLSQSGEFSKESSITGSMEFIFHPFNQWTHHSDQLPIDNDIEILYTIYYIDVSINTKVVQTPPWYIDNVEYSFQLTVNGLINVNGLPMNGKTIFEDSYSLDSSALKSTFTDENYNFALFGILRALGLVDFPVTWIVGEVNDPSGKYLISPEFGNETLDSTFTMTQTVHVVGPSPSPVPLPPTLLFLGSGLLGLMGWRSFRKV